MNSLFRPRVEPVSIVRDCYTMSSPGGAEAEITLYGQIVKKRPTASFWGDEPAKGNYIILDEFLEDLKAVQNAKRLTIRLDSIGGDAYASITITNKLRELKAKKTIRVDGVAMSGGAMILCSACNPGDKVEVNPGSLIMIHKCSSALWGRFTADDLDRLSENQKAMDRAQVAILKAKCKLPEDELLEMMGRETTLTGAEAVEKGFADTLLDGEKTVEIAASADRRTLFVNGRTMDVSDFIDLPEFIPTAAPLAEENETTETDKQQGGDLIMAKNLEELKAENPELAESLLAEAKTAATADLDTQVSAAVKAERERLAAIDEIAALYDEDTLKSAKYGDTACTAQKMAFEAAKKAAQQGKAFLDDLSTDAKASGTDKVTAAPAPQDEPKALSPEERKAMGKADAQAMKKE